MNNGIVNTASRVTRYMDNIVVGWAISLQHF
jgi:hypothetical protein